MLISRDTATKVSKPMALEKERLKYVLSKIDIFRLCKTVLKLKL